MKFTARKDDNFEGFTMTFANNLTISVQYGKGNYCTKNGNNESISAEIAIWNENRKWYTFDDNDTVLGHQTPDEVAEWIRKVSAGEIEIEDEMTKSLKEIKRLVSIDMLYEATDKLDNLIQSLK